MTKTQVKVYRKVFTYYAYLLVVWGFFRFLFKFPELVEELWFKPILWLLPLLYLWLSERKRIDFFAGSVVKSLLWGLGVGLAYWGILALIQWLRSGFATLVIDFQNPQVINFLGIALATAITEELAFSGYIFQKLESAMKQVWSPLLWTVGMFALLHIPIGLFLYRYSPYQMIFFLVLVFVVQMGNVYVMSRTRNVLGSILSHWAWSLGAFLLL